MLYLKCTAEVQKVLGLRKENLAIAQPSDAPLGNWYVNRFPVGRRKAFIFMSEPTLLPFILFQGKTKFTPESLPVMLLGGLEQLLQLHGLPPKTIEGALARYHTGLYAKTDSRADLGSLNDLVRLYQWRIEDDGGLDRCDLTKIILQINETPQRRIGWHGSWKTVDSLLAT
jgi:hypothetical protein